MTKSLYNTTGSLNKDGEKINKESNGTVTQNMKRIEKITYCVPKTRSKNPFVERWR